MARKPAPAAMPRFEASEEWVSSLPFDRLPKGIMHLPLECVVYVPSTRGDRVIPAQEFAERRDQTADLLVDLFGGCRESMATGRYRGKEGEIVSEEVAVITGFGDADDYEGKRQAFLAWLIDKREEWEQEALGFEFEGDLWYL
ncbi:MAG TPA: hypothetical protein VGB28_09200 [Actinomycetota bacterium]